VQISFSKVSSVSLPGPALQDSPRGSTLLPDKHPVDAGYIEASNLVESRREYDIDLIGPAQSNGRRRQVQGNGFDISNFQVEWDREKVICPAGRESSSWKPMVDRRGNDFIHVAIDAVRTSISSRQLSPQPSYSVVESLWVQPQPFRRLRVAAGGSHQIFVDGE